MVTLDFEKTGGLLPAIVADYKTGDVLMLAYMNRAAWENTLNTGKATYYSRSRNKLWVKGKPPVTPSKSGKSGSTATGIPSC